MNENIFDKRRLKTFSNCKDLVRSMVGTRDGVIVYNEKFRLDLENTCYKASMYEDLQQENQALKNTIKRCYTPEEIDFEIMPVKAELQAEKDINNNLHKTIDKLRINLYETQQENEKLKKMVNFGGITIVNCPECNKEINVNFCRETEEYRKKYQELKEKYEKLEDKYIHNVPCCNEEDCGLFKEYQQLKDNWNKLKEWLEEETIQHWNTTILGKMQELGWNNEL